MAEALPENLTQICKCARAGLFKKTRRKGKGDVEFLDLVEKFEMSDINQIQKRITCLENDVNFFLVTNYESL